MSKSTKSVVAEATVKNTAVESTIKEGSVDKVVKCVALADSKGRKIIYTATPEGMMHVQVPNWYRETLELKKPFELTVVPCANGKWFNAVGLVNPNASEKKSAKKSGMSKKAQDEILAYLNGTSEAGSGSDPDTEGWADEAIAEQTSPVDSTVDSTVEE